MKVSPTGTETNSFSKQDLPVSDRLKAFPTYIFSEIAAIKSGLPADKLIDLSLGSPDQATPDAILQSLHQASLKTANHGYPPFDGKLDLRRAIVTWLKSRFPFVSELNESHVLPLIGSKEGLAHLPLACLNPGDLAIIPDPHYPVHRRGPQIAGAEIFDLPLLAQNNFLPDLESIPKPVLDKAKLWTINYPNNPTGAIANPSFLREVTELARQRGILLCSDLAYCEMGFGGHKPQSIFEYLSLEEAAIEFFTFSKTYHMAGWRIGFCVGNPKLISALFALKSNMDYGISGAVQDAAVTALSLPASYYDTLRTLYSSRASLVYKKLTEELGWEVYEPNGAMYLWLKSPDGSDGACFAKRLLRECHIVVTPGLAFGEQGRDYVRIALVRPEEDLLRACERMKMLKLEK